MLWAVMLPLIMLLSVRVFYSFKRIRNVNIYFIIIAGEVADFILDGNFPYFGIK